MLDIESIHLDCPDLQDHYWPPVAAFGEFSKELSDFMEFDREAKMKYLESLRHDYHEHGGFLNKSLGVIYAYVYTYKDSPCYMRSDPDLEIKLMEAKILLEEEYMNEWLTPRDMPNINNQEDLADYLREFVVSDNVLYHEFWGYLENEAGEAAMHEFLRLVLARNEIVDDETAFLVCGLQGNMKKVTTSNLWDECGNGSLERFHTYWLRRLLDRTDQWEGLPEYRSQGKKPWSAGILSNTFNVFLTRPHLKYRAYGFFVNTESWVEPHFEPVLTGLKRLGLDHEDIAVYFLAHTTIDPQHSQELIDAIEYQTPRLNQTEINEILIGSNHAMSAALFQYRDVLEHLREVDRIAKEQEAVAECV